MTKMTLVLAVAGLVAASGVANVNAQSSSSFAGGSVRGSSPASNVPDTALFLGLGGSYNAFNFGTQNVYAVGTSNVFQNGILTSTGSAAGPANVYIGPGSTLAFSVQGGYFQKFLGSNWLWGAKFAYSYLGATSNVRNALLPQAGSFTATGSTTPVPFTGNALVGSYQTNIIQQMALIPFIGRSFEKSFVYAGAGPTLSQTRTNLNGLIGFADINGTRTDVSGTPIDLSSSGWVYGGAAVVGATYFLDPSWFIDFSYTFAMTANQTSNYSSPFTNPNGTNGSTIVGTLVGTSSGKVITQGVTASVNKAF
jgi:hypothetical protein